MLSSLNKCQANQYREQNFRHTKHEIRAKPVRKRKKNKVLPRERHLAGVRQTLAGKQKGQLRMRKKYRKIQKMNRKSQGPLG